MIGERAERRRLAFVAAIAALGVTACGARSELPFCDNEGQELVCESVCGLGVRRCSQGQWSPCSAPIPKDEVPIEGIVRDFSDIHPDFEDAIGDDPGMVLPDLGEGGDPVYAGAPTTPTTTGKINFDTWFRDVEGVNVSAPFTITLTRAPGQEGLFHFANDAFFPIDGALLGNEGRDHNYHFTFELHTEFRYAGGEVFSFTGDDDLWVFVNNKLVIDLGGVHSAELGSVDLDLVAQDIGLTIGDVYPLALFFAERHTTSSTFQIDTTIAEFHVCP